MGVEIGAVEPVIGHQDPAAGCIGNKYKYLVFSIISVPRRLLGAMQYTKSIEITKAKLNERVWVGESISWKQS